MAKNINYVSHKKSKVKINGKPQLPSADSLVEGEIAVNFAENVETLSIKNESGAVVTFSSDNYYSEQKLGSAFTGANSAVTVTDEFGLYVKKTDVDQVIDETTSASTSAVSTSAVYDLVGSGFTSSSITDVIIENEEIVSNALIDLDERKLDASAYTPTDLSNYYTKSETSGATEISTALSTKANTATTLAGYGITDAYTKSKTSGATQISNALSAKVDSTTYNTHTGDTTIHFTTGTVQTQIDNSISGKVNTSDVISAITPSNSGSTNPIATKVVAENELIVSNALTDLDERKLDASAYTPTTLLEEITYSALKSKRDNGQLVQGQWYRITDYTCTTTQENTQSAGHLFDIIVRADANNMLNENASAIKHSGDTYFTNASAKLEAWELKYCLDNDTNRFMWADDGNNGKGVIYYMKDEWGNECPYDFKNIQFTRYKITASTKCPDLIGLYAIDGATDVTVDTATTYWSYTFCMYDLNENAPCDVSTYQDKYYSDEGFCYKNYNNVFKSYLEPLHDEDGLVPMKLLDNVFITDTDICSIEESHGEFYGFYSNTLGNDNYNNTFGNNNFSNTFGNSCNSNTFGNNNFSNTFGNNNRYNTFGNNFQNNSFGNNNRYNTFWKYFQNNSFGNNNYNNTFGNSCGSNTFGNNNRYNTFGNYNFSNTFGNDNYNNTFGNNNFSNTFGSSCGSNTFGNNNRYNTFGNSCQYITFSKDYYYYNIVENGNQYIMLTSTQTTSSSNPLRNIKICQGVNNTTTTKTISHNTVNDTFQTEYKPVNSQIINV